MKFSGAFLKRPRLGQSASRATLLVDGIDDLDTGVPKNIENLEPGCMISGVIDVSTPFIPADARIQLEFVLEGKYIESGFKTKCNKEGKGFTSDATYEKTWLEEVTKVGMYIHPLQPTPEVLATTAPLSEGLHTLRYPFTYKLPPEERLCASYHVRRHGRQEKKCAYEITVRVAHKEPRVKLDPVTRSIYVLGRKATAVERLTSPPIVRDNGVLSFKRKDTAVQANVQCDSYCYLEGQAINITSNIVNTSRNKPLQMAKISLLEQCVYFRVDRNNNKVHPMTSRAVLVTHTVNRMEISPEERRKVQFELRIPDVMEPTTTSLRSRHGTVEIEFYVQVHYQAKVSSTEFVTDYVIEVPIVITPDPKRYFRPPVPLTSTYQQPINLQRNLQARATTPALTHVHTQPPQPSISVRRTASCADASDHLPLPNPSLCGRSAPSSPTPSLPPYTYFPHTQQPHSPPPSHFHDDTPPVPLVPNLESQLTPSPTNQPNHTNHVNDANDANELISQSMHRWVDPPSNWVPSLGPPRTPDMDTGTDDVTIPEVPESSAVLPAYRPQKGGSHVFWITLVCATELHDPTMQVRAGPRQTDPYVVLWVNRTHVRQSGLCRVDEWGNPLWNETFRIPLSHEETRRPVMLELRCYDHSLRVAGQDRMLGQATIEIEPMAAEPQSRDIILHVVDADGNAVEGGSLELVVFPVGG